jgi:hypothetical protein
MSRLTRIGVLGLCAMALVACAGTPNRQLDLADISTLLDQEVYPIDPGNLELRMLRAHAVIAGFSRYGEASIRRYSEDRSGDAAKLLARIGVAESQLAATLQTLRPQRQAFRYPLERAELTIVVLELVDTAARPTVRGLGRGLVTASAFDRISTAKTVFVNLLRDRLFKEAYLQGTRDLLQAVAQRGPSARPEQGDWGQVTEDLNDTCGKLAAMLGQTAGAAQAAACVPETVGPAQ